MARVGAAGVGASADVSFRRDAGRHGGGLDRIVPLGGGFLGRPRVAKDGPEAGTPCAKNDTPMSENFRSTNNSSTTTFATSTTAEQQQRQPRAIDDGVGIAIVRKVATAAGDEPRPLLGKATREQVPPWLTDGLTELEGDGFKIKKNLGVRAVRSHVFGHSRYLAKKTLHACRPKSHLRKTRRATQANKPSAIGGKHEAQASHAGQDGYLGAMNCMAQMCWKGGGLLWYEVRMLIGRRKCRRSFLTSPLTRTIAMGREDRRSRGRMGERTRGQERRVPQQLEDKPAAQAV